MVPQHAEGAKAHGFRIPAQELLRKAEKANAPAISSVLMESDAVISAREIGAMYSEKSRKRFGVYQIPDEELFSLLRACGMDGNGRMVYKDASFEVRKHEVHEVRSVQTFVLQSKLDELHAREGFLKGLGIRGDDGSSYVITFKGERRYASMLIPPVVIHYRSGDFTEPMRIAEERLRNGDAIAIKGANGVVEFDLKRALEEIARAVASSDTVPVVKDGTHRAYRHFSGGNGIAAITISNQYEMPTNIPARFEMMIVTTVKPSARDRYPGYVPAALMDLESLGIDA